MVHQASLQYIFVQSYSIILNTVSSHIHLPCFCYIRLHWTLLSTDYIYETLIGQVTPDLLFTRFTCCIKDNQQGWSRLSNWFSLGVWGRGWTTCLLYERLIWWRYFSGFPCLYSCYRYLYICIYVHVLLMIFPLKLIYGQITFFLLNTLHWHFP